MYEEIIRQAIGVVILTGILINTFDTVVIYDQEISKLVNEVFYFRPGEMKKELKLDGVKFKQVAPHGHFGKEDLDVPWEGVDHKIRLTVDNVKGPTISINQGKPRTSL